MPIPKIIKNKSIPKHGAQMCPSAALQRYEYSHLNR
jgi:hypothetical protein